MAVHPTPRRLRWRLIRRPSDLFSYVIRRLALLRKFSRSPFDGSVLEVVRSPDPARLDGDVGRSLHLAVLDWSVYEYTLFVKLTAEAVPGRAAPTHGLVLFSSCAVRFPLETNLPTHVAVPLPATHLGGSAGLAIELDDGTMVVESEPGALALQGDAAAQLFLRFQSELGSRPPGRLLEIGSRARSGNEYRSFVPAEWEYTGLDVKTGPNVDLVGDAHELSSVVGDRRFDAVFSVSVFEHLLIPWKVILEVNRVLLDDGLLFITTHQTFPLHDQPWDFFRFSDRAWVSMLNDDTGFEIVDTALGEPATVVPRAANRATWNPQPEPAFLLSCVLARKVGDARVSWPVDAKQLLVSEYPH